MLNGQKLQGPITAKEVNYMLANKSMEDKYDLDFFLEYFRKLKNLHFFKLLTLSLDNFYLQTDSHCSQQSTTFVSENLSQIN